MVNYEISFFDFLCTYGEAVGTACLRVWRHDDTACKPDLCVNGACINGVSLCLDSFLGGGVLVIGQEQDSRGGRFSISESFVGRLSKLNIWDFVLPTEKIVQLTTTCDDYIGNLIAWPDFLSGINGRVQKLETDICKGRLKTQGPIFTLLI